MTSRLDVPDRDVLAALPVEVATGDEPWVATIRAVADDGVIVEMTWDQVAASVAAAVLSDGVPVFRAERESITSIRVLKSELGLHFEAELEAGDLGGVLIIDIGPTVAVRDVLLRQ